MMSVSESKHDNITASGTPNVSAITTTSVLSVQSFHKFNLLPKVLVELVVSFLSMNDILLCLQRSCKLWDPYVKWGLSKCNRLKLLAAPDRALLPDAHTFPNISRLELVGNPIYKPVLFYFKKLNTGNIKELILNELSFNQFEVTFPNMTHITFIRTWATLSLANVNAKGATVDFLNNLLKLPCLTKLTFNQTFYEIGAPVFKIISKIETLKCLELINMNIREDAGLGLNIWELLAEMKNLDTIIINNCYNTYVDTKIIRKLLCMPFHNKITVITNVKLNEDTINTYQYESFPIRNDNNDKNNSDNSNNAIDEEVWFETVDSKSGFSYWYNLKMVSTWTNKNKNNGYSKQP